MVKIELLVSCSKFMRGNFFSFKKGEILEANLTQMSATDAIFADVKLDGHKISFLNYGSSKQFKILDQ